MIIELLDAEEAQREYVDEQRREASADATAETAVKAVLGIMKAFDCSIEKAMHAAQVPASVQKLVEEVARTMAEERSE